MNNQSAQLRIVELRTLTLRDCAGHLRELAQRIEKGEYGEVGCIGIALLGDTFEVFGYGDGLKQDGIGPSVASLFRAGALRLEMEVEAWGR